MYTFNDWRGTHKITLSRASAEWVNSDCPDILAPDGTTVITSDLSGIHIFPKCDEETAWLKIFIRQSDKAFCHKYNSLGYKPGTLEKKIVIH